MLISNIEIISERSFPVLYSFACNVYSLLICPYKVTYKEKDKSRKPHKN